MKFVSGNSLPNGSDTSKLLLSVIPSGMVFRESASKSLKISVQLDDEFTGKQRSY